MFTFELRTIKDSSWGELLSVNFCIKFISFIDTFKPFILLFIRLNTYFKSFCMSTNNFECFNLFVSVSANFVQIRWPKGDFMLSKQKKQMF